VRNTPLEAKGVTVLLLRLGGRIFYFRMEVSMDKRVAVLAIIVENRDSVARVNAILHEYADYIIGRMGIPHREKGISIISVIFDAPGDLINAASGMIGRLAGISAKTLYSA